MIDLDWFFNLYFNEENFINYVDVYICICKYLYVFKKLIFVFIFSKIKNDYLIISGFGIIDFYKIKI